MKEVCKEDIVLTLQQLGVRPGDGLLVHSAVQYLGRPVGGVGMYLDAIQEVIGPDGTIAVPTFNFSFAKGEPYDPQITASLGMGAFSEFVRCLPEARRTPHPMQSLAVVGRDTADLAGRDTPSAFDPGSAFERMLELDYKLLLLGAGSEAISMFHYSEQRAQVPYRYWKDFTAPYRLPTGGWETRTYRMYVRDLDLNPRLTLEPVAAYMQTIGQWRSVKLNYGEITICRLQDFTAAADAFLARDPWSLVLNRS